MTNGLGQAKRFQDLLGHPDPGAPYDFTAVFTAKTWGERRLSKRRFKLLKRIDPRIREMLEEGERVRCVTWGTAVSFWASYWLGWASYYLNQRALIVTDRRVLLIQIDSRRRARELRDQLRYQAIDEIKRTLLGNTKIKMRSGKTRLFSRVPGRDRAVLQQVLRDLRGKIGPDHAIEDIEHLCPHCFGVVKGYPKKCPSCAGAFKSSEKAGLLSLAFPGLGDLYLGHRKFGLFELLVALFVWVSFWIPNPQYSRTALGLTLGAALLFAIVHGTDAIGTRYVARMGIYPGHGPDAHAR
jgi:hypothetical protein